MADLATILNELAATFPTVGGRLLVSVGAIAGVVLIGWGLRRLGDAYSDSLEPTVVDLAVSILATVVGLTGTAVLIGVWGFADELAGALGSVNPAERAAEVTLTIAVVIAAYVLTGLVRRLIEQLVGGRTAVSDHQREVSYRVTQVILYSTAGIVVLGVWDVNVGGLLVGAGFLGIVLGMAARQTLGALIAGFVLMFSRPFEIGDWVQVGEQEGIVTDITVVDTRIQTFDGEYLMIPNDVVGANTVVNRTRKGRLRLTMEIGVDYETDLSAAAEVAVDAMRELDDVLTVPTPDVVFKRFDDSAIVLEARFWIDKPSARRKWRARTAVLRAIKTGFEEADVTIPFPQRTLSDRDAPGEVSLVEGTAAVEANGGDPVSETVDSGGDPVSETVDSGTDPESEAADSGTDPESEAADSEAEHEGESGESGGGAE